MRAGLTLVRKGNSGPQALISSVLVCVVLGSIHAFSMFLEPLEGALQLPRATISLTYSFALVALTVTVLLGPKLYSAAPPARLFILSGLLGAIGALIAGISNGVIGVWIGYSLCFGVANGLGYGFALQYAAVGNPTRPGYAMGVVTAAYASGAALAPFVFVQAVQLGGLFAAMLVLALVLLLVAALSAWFAANSGVAFARRSQSAEPHLPKASKIIRLWLAYGSGVAAGLMVIGHAAGIAEIAGLTPWIAPALLALCNLIGSLIGGSLIDRFSHRATLATLPLFSAVGLAVLVIYPPASLIALGVVGFAYGGTIAAYPAVIARQNPGSVGPKVYGYVFTAWGTAGLIAPWSAGYLFDQSQSYLIALWIALGFALLSAALAARLIR